MAKFMNMTVRTGHISKSKLNDEHTLLALYQEGSETKGCDSYKIKIANLKVLNNIKDYTDIIGQYPTRRRYNHRKRPATDLRLPNDQDLMVKSLM